MIEATVISYLGTKTKIKTYAERPKNPDSEFIIKQDEQIPNILKPMEQKIMFILLMLVELQQAEYSQQFWSSINNLMEQLKFLMYLCHIWVANILNR